jgi:hypothetical protein
MSKRRPFSSICNLGHNAILETEDGPQFACSRSSRHVYTLQLVIIYQTVHGSTAQTPQLIRAVSACSWGLRQWILVVSQHFLSFCRCFVALNADTSRPWKVDAIQNSCPA